MLWGVRCECVDECVGECGDVLMMCRWRVDVDDVLMC